MPEITVGLRDGFHNDEVRIYVDAREVYGKTGVNTKLVTSFADEWKGNAPGGHIRVELPKRNLSATTAVDALTRYVMVTVYGDQLKVSALTEGVPQM